MNDFVYTVCGTFSDDRVAGEWIEWLSGGHIREVLDAGAVDSEIVRMDGVEHSYEVRHHFASRDAFAAYERDHAPRLRADGLKLFPAERGITYRRSTGTVIAQLRRDT